jgi:hypothetical protein
MGSEKRPSATLSDNLGATKNSSTRLAPLNADFLIANVFPCNCRYREVQIQDRNSTDSRWNIFTAIKMAAPPYRHVERKISAIEFQW